MSVSIGLVIRPGNEQVIEKAREVLAWCTQRGVTVLPEVQTASLLGLSDKSYGPEELVQKADPILTLGGDGTLIGVARYVRGKSPVFVGVNFGNLGFLTEVSPDEVCQVLDAALSQSAACAERVLLHVQVVRDGQVLFESQAVNDVVVQKGATAPLPDLDLLVNEQSVARIRADGIIFATPTGSTAYSLAAGGSIAHPSLDVILVTPVCPHSLTNRPIILPGNATIEVNVPAVQEQVLVTVDGQVSEQVQPGDSIRVVQAKQTVSFVLSPKKGYFDILRTKLNWGAPNQPD
jgi:NAD+ kinase